MIIKEEFQIQFLCTCQCSRKMLFHKIEATVVAADGANAAQHWEKMAKQNVHIIRWIYLFHVEIHVREKWPDLVEKVQNFVIEVTG